MCSPSCREIVTFVDFEKEGFRIPRPLAASSMPSSSTFSAAAASSCFCSSPGDSLSSGVGANEELVADPSFANPGG